MKFNKLSIIGSLLVVVILISFFSNWVALKSLALFHEGAVRTNTIKQDQMEPLFPQAAPDAYPLHPGYPIVLIGKWVEKSSVVIADIQNDGQSELLLPTFMGEVYAWDESGKLLPGFPFTIPGWRVSRQLALGDFNKDRSLEIAAGAESITLGVGPRIYIWHQDGSLLTGWPQNTACARVDYKCSVAAINLIDLDKDYSLEVVAGSNNRDLTTSDPSQYVPNLYVWKSNGQLAPGSWPNDDDHNVAIQGYMAVGDLDGDSYPDIITGRDYNRLFAFNRLGANLSGWPHYVWWPYDNNNWEDDQIEFARSAATLADLDNDGVLEYIIAGLRRYAHSSTYYNTELLIYAPNGKRWTGWEISASGAGLLSSTLAHRTLQAPAIADLNGDHHPDIIVSTQDGWVRAYTAEKQLLWGLNYSQGKLHYATETVIGDVDGDGWNEVIFGTFDGNLGSTGPVGIWILEHNGVVKDGWSPMEVTAPGITAAPSLGDLDSDGLIEIAAATWYGRVYVWDAPGLALPGRLPWPMARHDLQRTGHYVNPEPDFDRSTMTVSNFTPDPGDSITYTIQLIQSGTPVNENLQLTDALPDGLNYVLGSLTATSGVVDDSQAPMLRWNGTLFDIDQVRLTYVVTLDPGTDGAITNIAVVDAGSAGQFRRSITIFVSGDSLHLPFVQR